MIDTYYQSPEVSNSDLTALEQYFHPQKMFFDPEIAFKFGNLFDFICTEPHKVNFFKRTITEYPEPFTPETWEIAEQMKKSLYKDAFFRQILPLASYQVIFKEPVTFEYGSLSFVLKMRCKYDFFMSALKWGGDLKSTACTTQKAFVEACRFFDYDRSRVLYMLLSGAEKDMIIGVSKKNFKVFKVPIVRGDEIWISGMEKLRELAYKWWYLYENF
jgi:hypothetical protein